MSNKLKSTKELLTSVDSLFTTQAERDDELKPKVEEIALDLIDGFEGHPFSVKDTENLLRQLSDHFDELISWAELYESASLEKKKMVVNALINRIEVSRDYKVKIDFNFDFEQFTQGLDIAA